MKLLQKTVLIMTISLGLYVIISNQLNYSNDFVFIPFLVITIGLFLLYLWTKKKKS
ncbi:hypothetical protein [Alkalihalobacterium alkalinitrilicum]|uniref:hypothetical protein n=1 Tax=Alkalihalobacterium alkalinitrilicum TaxID=427920 RepID=UPI00130317D5|nr:hypothetical protein [Alkalihalobacterium alkalinitrilicum]